MTLEEFNTLTPEEQTAILTDRDALTARVDDLTAERNSFETENKSLTERVDALTKEVATTKEMNYTLTRKLNLDNHSNKPADELLHEMFM